MQALINCEMSGRVRNAFRALGHDAWSCDLLPALDESPYHLQMDALEAINAGWDMMIAHPPCDYLTSAGVRWLQDQPPLKSGKLVGLDRRLAQAEAIKFFMALMNAPIEAIALENPIGAMSTAYRKPDQIIQPWMFGEYETKQTCLWLKGLPLLIPTYKTAEECREALGLPAGTKPTPRVHYESPGIKDGLTREQRRSLTYQGIADAMALQWGNS